MSIQDYYQVINFIYDELKGKNVIVLYQQLISSLQQLQQASSPEASQLLIDKKKETFSVLESTEPKDWDSVKMKVFYKFGGSNLVGNAVVIRLKNIFDEYQANSAGAVTQIQGLINETNALLESIAKLREGLSAMVEEDAEEKPEEGHETIQLIFDKDASINTLPNLESYAKIWQDILRNVSRLANEPSEDAHILHIQKNSPLVITIDAPVGVIAVLYFLVDKTLDLYGKVLTVRQKREELKALKLNNKKMEKALQEGEKEEIESLPKQVTDAAAAQFKDKLEGKADVEEIKIAVTVSVKEIYEFIDKGGTVDVSEGRQESTQVQQMRLAQNYTKIHQLQDTTPGRRLLQKQSSVEDNLLQENEDSTPPPAVAQ